MRSAVPSGKSLAVVGAGYVGLTTAVCMAELGHRVTLIELDRRRLQMLRVGRLPFHEPELSPLLRMGVGEGRLEFAAATPGALDGVGFAFITVGTPQGSGGRPDLTAVVAAAQMIAEGARGDLTVVVKSTVPVGTGDLLERLFLERCAAGAVDVVSNPEFLREGSAVHDFFEPDRIIVGAVDPAAAERVSGLYASLKAPTLVTDRRSAELAKYASNAFLATRISFCNELAAIAEATGADVASALRGMGMDRRIGDSFLRPGLGYGGSCFGKDVAGLIAQARAGGVRARILQAVEDVNVALPELALQRLAVELGDIGGRTVALLGLAFKPGTDDIRAAPGLALARRLIDEGARVQAHDPLALSNATAQLPRIHGCRDPYRAVAGADAVVLVTEWPELVRLDFERVLRSMRGRVILDGRGALERERLETIGFRYLCFGGQPEGRGAGIGSEGLDNLDERTVVPMPAEAPDDAA